jgi:transmembrane sensor
MSDTIQSPAGADARVIAADAERWLGRHDRGLTSREQAEFAAWHAMSPAHAAAFEQLAVAWRLADDAKADPSLVALAEQADLATRREQRLRRLRRTRLVWATGLATAAAIAFVFISPRNGQLSRTADAHSTTQISSTVALVPSAARVITLPDGSVAELRDSSEVRTVFTTGERRVQLLRGEAHFTVEKDAARPFIVEAGQLAVRAVGTAFNVKLGGGAIEVLVTEGTVSLHPAKLTIAAPERSAQTAAPQLSAGQRVVLEEATGGVDLKALTIQAVASATIEQALAWQGARIVLHRAPLGDAIAAFNRQGRDRLELGAEELRARQLSGTFRADNAEAFVRLLEKAAEVQVERRPDGVIVLHPAR